MAPALKLGAFLLFEVPVVPLAALLAGGGFVGGFVLGRSAHGEAGGDRSCDDIPHWMQDMR